jgi:tight adherence protein C
MGLVQLSILVLVFLSVSLLVGGVYFLLSPSALGRRLGQLAGPAGLRQGEEDGWQRKAAKALGPIGKLATPKEGWEQSPLRQRFMHAGWRDENAATLYFGAKTVLTFALPGLAVLFIAFSGVQAQEKGLLLTVIGLAAAGYYLPNVILSRRVSARKRELFESLPDAVDLMMVCMEAGLGLDAAIARVAQEMRLKSADLADELYLVGLELRAGASRERALRNFALRTGVEEVDELVTMLVQCDRFGTSIAESLRVHADTLRTKRRQRAEEAAAKIPVKLLFPLIFFIFPALLLVLMGPAIISIYRVLLPAMTGG